MCVLPLFIWIVNGNKINDFSYMYLPNPSAREGCDTRSVFKQTSTGLKSEFFILLTGYHTVDKEPNLSYCLSIYGGRFIPFPRLLVQCEKQTASLRFWTRLVVSVSYDEKHKNHLFGSYCACQPLLDYLMLKKVRSPDGDTDYFDIVAGVLQGDTLALHLVIICLDYVLKTSIDKIKENGFKLTKEKSRRYLAKTITDADYAQTETLLHSLERAAAGIGFHVNAHDGIYML